MSQKKQADVAYDEKQRVVLTIEMDQMDPLTIKVKLKTKCGKIFKAYGDARGLDIQYLKFLYDGHNLSSETTIGDAVKGDLEDADKDDNGCCTFVIHAFSNQQGG
eukprot:97052_1